MSQGHPLLQQRQGTAAGQALGPPASACRAASRRRGGGSAAEGGERGGERVDARVCASDLEAACFSLEKNKTQLTSVARRPVPGRGRQRQRHVAAPHSCECSRCVAGLPGPRSTHRTHSPAVASQLAVRNELSDEWFGILAGGVQYRLLTVHVLVPISSAQPSSAPLTGLTLHRTRSRGTGGHGQQHFRPLGPARPSAPISRSAPWALRPRWKGWPL